jgi:hypothetical protein
LEERKPFYADVFQHWDDIAWSAYIGANSAVHPTVKDAPGGSTALVSSSNLYSSISAKTRWFGDEDRYNSDSEIPTIDIEPDTEDEDEIDED